MQAGKADIVRASLEELAKCMAFKAVFPLFGAPGSPLNSKQGMAVNSTSHFANGTCPLPPLPWLEPSGDGPHPVVCRKCRPAGSVCLDPVRCRAVGGGEEPAGQTRGGRSTDSRHNSPRMGTNEPGQALTYFLLLLLWIKDDIFLGPRLQEPKCQSEFVIRQSMAAPRRDNWGDEDHLKSILSMKCL